VNGPEGILLSFPLRLVSRAAGQSPSLEADRVRVGLASVPTDLGWSIPLRFYGPRGTIRTISAASSCGTAQPAEIAGRLVLIGATALGTADTFATPFDPVLPGVEVLATVTAHLRHADGLVRDPRVRKIDAGAAVAVAGLTVLGLALLPLGRGWSWPRAPAPPGLGAAYLAFGGGSG
jgi:adenylate cyclase